MASAFELDAGPEVVGINPMDAEQTSEIFSEDVFGRILCAATYHRLVGFLFRYGILSLLVLDHPFVNVSKTGRRREDSDLV